MPAQEKISMRKNLRRVQGRIREACRRAGRDPSEVTLVLVTKNVPVEKIREAYESGARDFGENRVQELCSKQPGLPSDIRWHFVGHLQTNKVKSILGGVHLLHSLDRPALAEEIQKQAEQKNLVVDALVQVNTSGESTKAGFTPEEIVGAALGGRPELEQSHSIGQPQGVAPTLEKLMQFNRIRIRGLMTIGPTPVGAALRGRPEPNADVPHLGRPHRGAPTFEDSIRGCFRNLRLLRDGLQKKFSLENFFHLSMGMSSDFEIAIEEGATLVRIGTAVFGERK